MKLIAISLLALAISSASAQKALAPPTVASTAAAAARPALLAAALPATQHGNTLAWTASSDADATTTANVYSVAGLCPTGTLLVSQFTKLASNVAPNGPFSDTAVTANKTKSYVVTNVIGGVETGVSNCVSATTPNFPPQGLSITAQ